MVQHSGFHWSVGRFIAELYKRYPSNANIWQDALQMRQEVSPG